MDIWKAILILATYLIAVVAVTDREKKNPTTQDTLGALLIITITVVALAFAIR